MPFGLPDPHMQGRPWEEARDGVQRNFDALASSVVGTGQRQLEVRAGVALLGFTASVSSASTTVAHGLGRIPVAVVLTSQGAPAFGQIPRCDVYFRDATNFMFTGEITNPYTGNMNVAWIAFG